MRSDSVVRVGDGVVKKDMATMICDGCRAEVRVPIGVVPGACRRCGCRQWALRRLDLSPVISVDC